ncbi:kynurenine formamidase [Leucobacter exalbidus]|uniref:Kynurenine formamidase n=1 Tax=Leucobacter exalbidus TaxID=662960 RepID=A0A940T355_9MICO|nr:cyclase family protein [Leucobacter exalbidus]MBP1325802.1 kynurenine formamidase [Leucobacter exalbidus]
MIDLSHSIRTGMTVYPGDPGVRCAQSLTIDADGAAVTAVSLGSHTGTHIDAPAHSIAGGRTIDEVSLGELVGDALVLHLTDRVRAGAPIDTAMLKDELTKFVAVPRIVLLHTGWDRHFASERALEHPYLTREAAAALWERGMRVLGTDALSPDRTASTSDGPVVGGGAGLGLGAAPGIFPVHDVVLGGDGLIVENLRGLERLGSLAKVGFFPLPLTGDGAPVRAVAWAPGEEGPRS